MPTRLPRALPVLVAMALVLAGCAGDPVMGPPGGMHEEPHHDGGHHGQGDHGDDTPAIEGAVEVDLIATSMSFEPDRLELTAGQPVNIRFRSLDIFHDLVIDGVDFHVGADGGEEALAGLVVDEPGTYLAYCTVAGHRAAGMEMEIVVSE